MFRDVESVVFSLERIGVLAAAHLGLPYLRNIWNRWSISVRFISVLCTHTANANNSRMLIRLAVRGMQRRACVGTAALAHVKEHLLAGLITRTDGNAMG